MSSSIPSPQGSRKTEEEELKEGKSPRGWWTSKDQRPSRHNSVGTHMSSQTLWRHVQGPHGFAPDGVAALKEVETSPISNSEDISN